MSTPKRWPGIVREYEKCSPEVQQYFQFLPNLAEGFPWDVAIAYLFSRVETAHIMTIYCGCVKCHKADTSLTWKALDTHHLTREGFRALYKTIFGRAISKEVEAKSTHAEKVRDRIMHGKPVHEDDKRKAVMDILAYAEALNLEVYDAAKFKPFGSLKGFKGRGQSLEKSTSRWVLRGIGFTGL